MNLFAVMLEPAWWLLQVKAFSWFALHVLNVLEEVETAPIKLNRFVLKCTKNPEISTDGWTIQRKEAGILLAVSIIRWYPALGP